MAFPTPPSPDQPIPNNPFYFPETYTVQGAYFPMPVGTGLSVSATGVISATGGGGAVSGIFAGPGISVSGNTGNVTINNTGVTDIIAGSGISISSGTGSVTITNTGATGTVTSITAGTGLSGGTITSAGTIALSNTGVTAAVYSNPTIAVDAQGRITSAASGTSVSSISVAPPLTSTGGANPTLGITAASTSQCGAVLLSDSFTSGSSSTAATSFAVKAAYDAAIQAIPKTCLTNTGDLLTATGPSTVYTLPVGTNGQVLTVDTACTGNLKWALPSSGSFIPTACITGKGALITGTAANTPTALAVGSDGQVLIACSTAPNGICWGTVGGGSGTVTSVVAGTGLTGGTITTTGTIALDTACVIQPSAYTAKGVILAATAAGAPTAVPAGANGRVLYACALNPAGVCWGTLPAAPGAATPTAQGLVLGCTTGAFSGANTSLGESSTGSSITSGSNNTAVGVQAGGQITSGSQNTAMGAAALSSSFSAAECANTAIGFAVGSNLGGSRNTLLGACSGTSAGCNNVGGDNNTLIGYAAGCDITSGSSNVAIGCGVTVASPTGDCQLAIGYAIGQNWITGDSTKAIKPGAGIIDCAGSCGTAGQVLMSNGANAICWGAPTIPAATPTVFGLVKGCTDATNAALGCNALRSVTTGTCNIAIGLNAGCSFTSGQWNIAIGSDTLAANNGQSNIAIGIGAIGSNIGGSQNTAVGEYALALHTNGITNTAMGPSAGYQLRSGDNNVFLGYYAGSNLTSGCNNVVIGFGASVCNPTGSCQLAIGWNFFGCNWLTGNGTKAIKPGAGVIDCANSCGTANMVLTSQGNAVQWKTVSSAIAAPNYGSFYDLTDQPNPTPGTTNLVQLSNTDIANNFSVVGGSQVTGTVPGTYNLQFSIQLVKTTASKSEVYIWLRKNGLTVANSNTEFNVAGNGEQNFAALNYLVQITTPGDYFELAWASADPNVRLDYLSPAPLGPDIPSVILTIVPVGA